MSGLGAKLRLPDGPLNAVVSALAIHHLDDEAKRDLVAAWAPAS